MKQGVEVWNEWWSENRDARVDLREAILFGARIYSGDLDGAVFKGADLLDLEIVPDVGVSEDG